MRKVRLGLVALAMAFAVAPQLNATGICIVMYGYKCNSGTIDCDFGRVNQVCQHDATDCSCRGGGGGGWGGGCDPGDVDCIFNQE